jgi:hypothetical protein
VADIEKISSEFSGTPLVLTAGIEFTNPQSARFEASLNYAESARDAGVPVIFVDSSPETTQGSWVADAHRQRGATVLSAETRGPATQRQQGLRDAVARGAEKIVGSNPEESSLPQFAGTLALALDTADILVVGRTPEGRNSLLPLQQRTDSLGSWLLTKTLDMPADTFAGPRGFTAAGAEAVIDYPADKPGLNSLLYLQMSIIAARARNLRIEGVEIDLIRPEAVTAEEAADPEFSGRQLDQLVAQLGPLLSHAEQTAPTMYKADLATVAGSHMPLLAAHNDLPYRLEKLDLFEGRLTYHYDYQPPKPDKTA